MEWTDESIDRLRSLWHEGHSTAEIGRRMQITKNAVVGKAHRLDLSARPSPIRKSGTAPTASLPAPTPLPRRAASLRPVAPVLLVDAPQVQKSTPAVSIQPTPVVDNVRVLRPPVAVVSPPVAVMASELANPAPRRRGLSCCWPLGEPGTKGFHFCGGEPTPGKPYCSDHAALAYVKLRDRRDSVA